MFSYTDLHGETHFLDEKVTSDKKEMEKLDREYSDKAKARMLKTDKSVFYCLKLLGRSSYQQGNYFLVPIDEAEKENIIKKYGDRFYIGIMHKGKIFN